VINLNLNKGRGIGHWALGIGHWALGIVSFYFLFPLPSSFFLLPSLPFSPSTQLGHHLFNLS
jgi:hypothetical protein